MGRKKKAGWGIIIYSIIIGILILTKVIEGTHAGGLWFIGVIIAAGYVKKGGGGKDAEGEL